MAQIAGQTGGGAGGAKGADRLDAIQIFAGSQPYGARVVPEQRIQRLDVIADQRQPRAVSADR